MRATDELIDLAERLTPSGVIGDGMVAHFHEVAARARAERTNAVPPDEPVAYLRDVDGSGSYHPCAKGDMRAFPVYAEPFEVTPLTSAEQMTLTRLRVVIDAGTLPKPAEAHIMDLRAVLALVARIR